MRTFEKISEAGNKVVAHPLAAALMFIAVVVWTILAFMYEMPKGWEQLGDALTVLLLFLMHRADQRDKDAVMVKLDEIARAVGRPEAQRANVESDEELQEKRESAGSCRI